MVQINNAPTQIIQDAMLLPGRFMPGRQIEVIEKPIENWPFYLAFAAFLLGCMTTLTLLGGAAYAKFAKVPTVYIVATQCDPRTDPKCR